MRGDAEMRLKDGTWKRVFFMGRLGCFFCINTRDLPMENRDLPMENSDLPMKNRDLTMKNRDLTMNNRDLTN